MSGRATIELESLLAPELFERLEAEAERRHLPLPEVVREAIETYLEDEVYEDTPDEEILAKLRESMADALAGRVIPADEAMAEIRRSLEADDETR